MNAEDILAGTASLFLALGDKTRLRLLNLMRDREICVSSFTGTLEQSQPLISRHLAYLRNSGLVEARRDGKWMHYTISAQLDENSRKLLFELFKWMENQEGLRTDREKYRLSSGEPEAPVAATPKRTRKPKRERTTERTITPVEIEPSFAEEEYTPVDEVPEYSHHNELEDFLL